MSALSEGEGKNRIGWERPAGIAGIELGGRGDGWVASKPRMESTSLCSISNDHVNGRRRKRFVGERSNMRKEPKLSEDV